MLKQMILVIVGIFVLAGVENLNAQEGPNRERRQLNRDRQRQTDRAERAAVRQEDRITKDERSDDLRGERPQQRRQQRRQQEEISADRPGREAGRQQRQLRRGQNQQMFGNWLDRLTEAYRQNDEEKMGRLIRRMHQRMEQLQGEKTPAGPLGRGFRGSAGRRERGFDVRRRGEGRHGWGRGAKDREGISHRGEGWRGRGRYTEDREGISRRGEGRRGWGKAAEDREGISRRGEGRRGRGRVAGDREVFSPRGEGGRGRAITDGRGVPSRAMGWRSQRGGEDEQEYRPRGAPRRERLGRLEQTDPNELPEEE